MPFADDIENDPYGSLTFGCVYFFSLQQTANVENLYEYTTALIKKKIKAAPENYDTRQISQSFILKGFKLKDARKRTTVGIS